MKKKLIFILVPVILAVIAAGVWLVLHEKNQSSNIVALIEENEDLTRKLYGLADKLDEATLELALRDERKAREPLEWGDGYNWMAIGNSLTWIESWQRGICSTRPDNDYFGIVKAWLESRHENVQAERCNYSDWEFSIVRASMFDQIVPYLSEKLDLVTIQLGENVSDVRTYRADLERLVIYIEEHCPSAQIILIDDFWNQERSDIRRSVAEEYGIPFADLGEIRGKAEHQSKEGMECLIADGRVITVSKEAETHPGDSGMAYIAEQLIKILETH